MLKSTQRPLQEAYDLAVLDLDGVVYIGPHAVAGAAEALAQAREAGMHLAFVTNNAARPPEAVAKHLRELGVTADASDVVTSAQAAARLLAVELNPAARVFVIGGEGLEVALREQGLEPVSRPEDDPEAVISGYAPDLPWGRVVQGSILVRSGLPWVASNTDLTIPTAHGTGPGNGVLVGVVASFAERDPVVAGKPQRPLFDETLLRVGGDRPLVIGDRLDTDIEGGRAAGMDTLLVTTGVTGLAELAEAPPARRPDFIATGLQSLADAQPEGDTEGRYAGWAATVVEDRLEITGEGSVDDWWRAAAVACWAHLDTTGVPADVGGVEPPA